MLSKIREIVGGPKQRYVKEGYNLDLTYVTPRVIAMAFPASGLEKTYRNSIDEVARLLHENHGDNFLVVNVSGRDYDYSKFKGKCMTLDWEDHCAPVLSTLVETCYKMQKFLLADRSGVVAVHCNHGKGRTGTLIISFLLFNNLFGSADEARQFYQGKRFRTGAGMGISQPCQLRYLGYMSSMNQELKPAVHAKKVKEIVLSGCDRLNKFYLVLKSVRTGKVLGETPVAVEDKASSVFRFQNGGVRVIADVLLQIVRVGKTGQHPEARLSFNTMFLQEGANEWRLQQFSPDNLVRKEVFGANFLLRMQVEEECRCQDEDCKKCKDAWLISEQYFWEKAREKKDKSKLIALKDRRLVVFGVDE